MALPRELALENHLSRGESARVTATAPTAPTAPTAGALLHVALTLPDEATVTLLHERLQQRGVRTTAIMDQGVTRSFLFLDNNGILLEAACARPNRRKSSTRIDWRAGWTARR
jgi:catechol-2,3-dioxygenase